MDSILFYIFSILALTGAVGVGASKNPVSSAISLIFTFLSLAVIYILLSAPFIAVIQILVYAGAIMVLFIFIIMLMNLRQSDLFIGGIQPLRFLGSLFGLAISFILITLLYRFRTASSSSLPNDFGSIERIGEMLFVRFLLPFEVISVLLLSALVGAFLIAKRER